MILSRIEAYRSRDGGYSLAQGSTSGNPYGCFLAVGAYEDLGSEPPNPSGLLLCLNAAAREDGSWTNLAPAADHAFGSSSAHGSTLATGAAVAVLERLTGLQTASGDHCPAFDLGRTGNWLLKMADPRGGFLAGPLAPVSDLLSTAVAVHTLALLGVSFRHLRDNLLGFVYSLWDERGGFLGYWGDQQPDPEYTFYALMVLGHLARYFATAGPASKD
ncbi:MAG: terpene cyclase/mutase family protein [Verrucomicrobiae bacterium]|nr:terpene cyclase/mutase family protein [Verrucomicrobiae bacterium]